MSDIRIEDIRSSTIDNFSITDGVVDFSIKLCTFKRTVGSFGSKVS